MSDSPDRRPVPASTRLVDALRELAAAVGSRPLTDRMFAEASVTVEELIVAEEELRVQAAELAASRDAVDAERERYAELFEMLPDAVIETDAHGRILEANDAAVRLLGVPVRSISGKLLVSFARNEDRKVVRRLLQQEPKPTGESLLRIVDRLGVERLVAASFTHRAGRGRPTVLWALRDLSYLDRLGATIQELGHLTGLQLLVGDHDPLAPLIARIITGSSAVLPGHVLVIRLEHEASIASSDELGGLLAAAESELGEGPGLDVTATMGVIDLTGVELGRRWPHLGRRALDLRARAVCSVPIVVEGEPVGTVTAWRTSDDAPAEPVGPFLSVVAEHLAIAHANRSLYREVIERGANLERALEHRGVIERAKGMIMCASGVAADEAFAILRVTSQHSNRKLRAVALDVVEGRMPFAELYRPDIAASRGDGGGAV
jgi:PAS domain S-box-containing protein